LHKDFSIFCYSPVGKIAEKAVCRSVFLTTWHCIFNKNGLLRTVFLQNVRKVSLTSNTSCKKI